MTEKLSEAVSKHTDIMKSFQKKTYEETFLTYKEQYYPVLESISKEWEDCKEEEKEIFLDKVVREYLEELSEIIEKSGKSKAVRHDKTDGFRMIQALYTIPMIRDTGLPAAEPLAEKLVEGWKEAYPKHIYKKGDFETIKNGFDEKHFCYITTAVCETLGKPDDCYELTMFRQFRDGYLRKQPEGETLIREYYEEAPRILKKIDESDDKDTVYHALWEEHLKPCLSLIEKGEDKACQERYIHMVRSLEKKYL